MIRKFAWMLLAAALLPACAIVVRPAGSVQVVGHLEPHGHAYVYLPAYHAYFCTVHDDWWWIDNGYWSYVTVRPSHIHVDVDVAWVDVDGDGPDPYLRYDSHSRDYPEHWRPGRRVGPPAGRGWGPPEGHDRGRGNDAERGRDADRGNKQDDPSLSGGETHKRRPEDGSPKGGSVEEPKDRGPRGGQEDASPPRKGRGGDRGNDRARGKDGDPGREGKGGEGKRAQGKGGEGKGGEGEEVEKPEGGKDGKGGERKDEKKGEEEQEGGDETKRDRRRNDPK